jgi:aminoglycoside 6'-N-acetyltransferase
MIAVVADLQGERVRFAAASSGGLSSGLAEIGAEPEIARWWGEITREHLLDKAEGRDDATGFAIEHEGEVIGLAQFSEPGEDEFKHANIDLFLTSSLHGRGLGRDAVRTLARWLIDERDHHRLTIDPALANEPAIRAYEAVGFKRVGVMRPLLARPPRASGRTAAARSCSRTSSRPSASRVRRRSLEHRGVGVDRRQPRLGPLGRLVREPASAPRRRG